MAPTHRGWDRLGSSYDRVAARYEAQFIDELDGKARNATLFELDELVSDSQAAGFEVRRAVERAPYPSEGEGSRLYIEAQSDRTSELDALGRLTR